MPVYGDINLISFARNGGKTMHAGAPTRWTGQVESIELRSRILLRVHTDGDDSLCLGLCRSRFVEQLSSCCL